MQKISAGKFHFEPPFTSFDHLVGTGEQRGRNFNAKRAGGGQIDDQLKLARLHYRQVGRLSTLEDFAGVDADLTVRFGLARSVAHEAASFRILAYIVDGWNRMSCRQCGKLETRAGKERIRPYHERVGSIANKRSEGSLDLATVARLNNVDLQPDGGRCRGHIPSCQFRLRNARIDKQADAHGSGNQFMQQPQLLCPQLGDEKIDTGRIAAWSAETRDKTNLDRVFGDGEDDGDRRGCHFG